MKRIACLLVLLAGCTSAPLDTDGDGFPDQEEQTAGSDPHNATSVPGPVAPAAPENATTAPTWGDLATAKLRPGASLGGYCTFNFLFHGQNGSAYVGTAAHCVDEVGQRVALGDGTEVGTVVLDDDLDDSGVDFALILIDADKHAIAHPQMFGFEGPTGAITTADLAAGDVIQIYGYGVLVGQQEATRAREGVLVDWNEKEYNVDMPAVNGDSGSSLLHESGKAFGIVSRYGFGNTPPSTDQGPMIPWIFERLEAGGYGDVQLATIDWAGDRTIAHTTAVVPATSPMRFPQAADLVPHIPSLGP